jgi:hypothetical protein
MPTAPFTDYDLTPEMVELLRAGAADGAGLCCRPGQVVKNFAALHECERFDLIRFLDIERPWITPAGRAAIGAPTESQANRAWLMNNYGPGSKPRLVPEKRNDPRTDFDYRSYKACGYVCTLLVKQPDARENPLTVRVGRTLRSDPQFLGPNNSIVQPESDARFLLTVMPSWLLKRAGFSTYPMPLDETEWSAEDCATWNRLRQVCMSINSRIRNAGRRAQEKRRFGEFA